MPCLGFRFVDKSLSSFIPAPHRLHYHYRPQPLSPLQTASQSPQTTCFGASTFVSASTVHVTSSPTTTTPTASATTMQNGLDASPSSVAYTKVASGTFPAIVTSSPTTSTRYDHTASSGSTSFTLTTQREYMTHITFAFVSAYSFPHLPTALDACFIWATSSANHEGHIACPSTSDSMPEPESTPMPTPSGVSSVVNEVTTSSEWCQPQERCSTMHPGASISAHIWHEPPTPPQQTGSTSVALDTVVTQTTQSGSFPLTTMSLQSISLGSHVSNPTTSSTVSPNNTSAYSSQLPLVLSLTLGVLVTVTLGMIVVRCHVRRRSKIILSIALSSGSGTSREQKDSSMEETSRVTGVTPSRPITSYRASTYTPEHATTYHSHTGESYQTSNRQLSDPFVDSSDMVSSRTSIHPASIHFVGKTSANSDTCQDEIEAPGSLIEASTSSLELHFVGPLVATDDSLTQTPCSPTWHYDGLSSASPPSLEKGLWNEEQQGQPSPVSLRAPSLASQKPFNLGVESARLRLHELLEEARKI